MSLRSVSLSELEIRDEATFRSVPLYARLKQHLLDCDYRFRVASEDGDTEDWARVLFLNLTFWRSEDANDVLADATLDADVVAHVAWHHLVHRLIGEGAGPPSADALLLSESVASAFDLFLLGSVLGRTRSSTFLDSSVPALTDVALDAGLSEVEVEALLDGVVADPAGAFEALRSLLFDVTTALVACADVDAAVDALESVREHRFAPLLHHYELSNWVLYARAHAGELAPQPDVRAIDAAMRASSVSLDWLDARCLGGRPE